MEVETIVQEIKRLPLAKRFLIMEQTLDSIKNDELNHQFLNDSNDINETSFSLISVNEKSLAKDWLSSEDDRWDKIL